MLALWYLSLAFGTSLLPTSYADSSVTFHRANSFAFPDAASSSMILNDAPDDLDGATATPLRTRTVNATLPPPRASPQSGLESSGSLWNPLGQTPLVISGESTTISPDVADRETLLNLARASWDAYHPIPDDEKWYDIHGVNWTSRFGWKPGQDGLRGHLFLSPDRSQGLVVFKGTSVSQLGLGGGSKDTPDSSKRDRLNDNLLFSCCCANVPWRVETTHPCDCKVGGGKCCQSCLTDALREEETYYTNAEAVVHYFRHKYPDTNLWLTGHSLGGSVAALVGIKWNLPTVTFEAPGERLAALRMGLISTAEEAVSLSHITHVYNNIDPLAQGECTGTLSLCAQAGYAMEAKCHTSRVVMYDLKKPGWSLALSAHRMQWVIALLEREDLEVPEAVPQLECEDCSSWEFGEFEETKSWWQKLRNWIGRSKELWS